MKPKNDMSLNLSEQIDVSPHQSIIDDEANKCFCDVQLVEVDLSVPVVENEDLEEIEDDGIKDPFVSHKLIWQEINDDFSDKRLAILNHQLSLETNTDVEPNPAVAFLENHIFPVLVKIIECTINKAKQEECIKHQKSAFNGIDYISEMLRNLNPLHPERKDNWAYIFDMDWVVNFLEKRPRPHYPFSWIWSREWAATLIQAHVRAYWVRRRPNVQEMRKFWKTIKKEREETVPSATIGYPGC